MLTNREIGALRTGELTDLVESLDTQRVWEFDTEETELIKTMLASDSCSAIGVASFIVQENRRHAEGIIPFLLHRIREQEPDWRNRVWGTLYLRLFIDVMSSKRMPWKAEYTDAVLHGLGVVDVGERLSAIQLVAGRFDEIFQDLFALVTSDMTGDAHSSIQMLEEKSREIDAALSDWSGKDITGFLPLVVRKRSIRALRVAALLKTGHRVSAIDSLESGLARVLWRAFSSLCEPFSRMRWGSGSRAMSVA